MYPRFKKYAKKQYINEKIGIQRYARGRARNYATQSGKYAGGALGGYLAGPIGAYAGSKLGSLTGKALGNAIFGHGDYTVPRTSHIKGRGIKDGGSMGRKTKKSVHMEKGEMVITHSEYIGELITDSTATSAFLSQTYGINAANAGCFPWLANVAQNFQEYSFDKLVFEVKALAAESAGASTVVPMGSVIVATQYDSMLPVFANKAQMENSDFAVSGKPSQSLMHAIECKPSMNVLGRYYCAGNSQPTTSGQSNNDIRFQNMGYVQIASVGIPTGGAALDISEIWVHYTVRLFKPTIVGQFNNIESAHYKLSSQLTASPLGAAVAATNNFMPLTFDSATAATKFYFPLNITEGTFLVLWTCTFSAGSAFVAGTSTVTNGSLVSIFATGGGGYDASTKVAAPVQGGATTTAATIALLVTVNAPGSSLCAVTIVTTTIGASPTYGDLFVTPWNQGMTY